MYYYDFRNKNPSKIAAQKLQEQLQTSPRREQEEAFTAEHQDWSDEALFEKFKEEKRRRRKQMKPLSTIGYLCYTQRLGDWGTLMGRVNAELQAEKLVK